MPDQETLPKPRVSVIVPTFNSLPYIEETHASIMSALDYYGEAEAIFCDNGSEDGTTAFFTSRPDPRTQVLHVPDAHIGAVRNAGARIATGDYLLFLDSDCTIPKSYLDSLVATFRATDADAVGSRVVLPSRAPWVPRTWHQMHFPHKSSNVDWLNSANFAVRRDVFQQIEGFSDSLETGEDAEIGARMTRNGYRLYQDLSLVVIHHRNPGTLSQFWRKEIWRGLGMFGTVRQNLFDKPVLMTFLHGVFLVFGLAVLAASSQSIPVRVAETLGLALTVPVAAVIYRAAQNRRLVSPLRSVALYFLYFTARLVSLSRIIRGKIVSI